MRFHYQLLLAAVAASAIFVVCSIQPLFAVASVQPPATQPTPSTDAADDPIPDEYSILHTNNAFMTGGGNGSGPAANSSESNLVFKGVINVGGKCTAFIEDLNSKQITPAIAGQSLAGGDIKAIDLDALQFESGGVVVRIEVGHTLSGGSPPPPPPPVTQPVPSPDGGNAPPGPTAAPDQNAPPQQQPPGRQRHG